MKKRNSIVTMLGLILMISAYHQTNAQVKAGARFGLNYEDVNLLNIRENNGFHVGTYINLNLLGIAALEPGLQYSHTSFYPNPDISSPKINLNYLQIPVIVRLSILPFVNVFAGPQTSLLVSKKLKGEEGNLKGVPGQEVGAVAGIGIKLPVGFNLQASYDFGLSNLSYNGHEIKNRVFKFSLGKDF